MGLRSNMHGRGELIEFVMQHSHQALATSVIPQSRYRIHLKLNKPGLVYDRTRRPLRRAQKTRDAGTRSSRSAPCVC